MDIETEPVAKAKKKKEGETQSKSGSSEYNGGRQR